MLGADADPSTHQALLHRIFDTIMNYHLHSPLSTSSVTFRFKLPGFFGIELFEVQNDLDSMNMKFFCPIVYLSRALSHSLALARSVSIMESEAMPASEALHRRLVVVAFTIDYGRSLDAAQTSEQHPIHSSLIFNINKAPVVEGRAQHGIS